MNPRPRRSSRRSGWAAATPVVLCLLSFLISPGEGSAQFATTEMSDNCDEDLLDRPNEGPVPYGRAPYDGRATRCEGSHGALRSMQLHLRSVFQQFAQVRLVKETPMTVDWLAPPDQDVIVEVDGVVGRHLYSLDTRIPGGFQGFIWDTEVLDAQAGAMVEAPRNALMVLAHTVDVDSGSPVYLPVSVYQQEGEPACGPIRMVVWSDALIAAISIEVRPDGGEFSEPRELGGAPYPVSDPYEFRVTEIAEPGDYQVRLTTDFGADESGRIEDNYLYHVRVPAQFQRACEG